MGEAVVDGCLAPPPTQKIYHLNALKKDRPTCRFNFHYLIIQLIYYFIIQELN